MADNISMPSTSKEHPPKIDQGKEEDLKEEKGSKKWVRKKTFKNVDYKSVDGGNKQVAPCFWDNKCNICEKTFATRLKRDRHMNEVHGNERVKCPDCEKTFSREEYMERHRIASHASSGSNFQCEICHKSFAHQRNLDRHKDESHAGGHFKCTECPATYVRQEKLQKHIENGKHLVEFYCEICHQKLVFKNMQAVEKHVKVKDGSRRKGYGIKIWCTSSSRNWDVYGSKGVQEEKEQFIRRGLKKAQDDK